MMIGRARYGRRMAGRTLERFAVRRFRALRSFPRQWESRLCIVWRASLTFRVAACARTSVEGWR
ncbi:MAG: hypothetical protein QOG83_503 [Alphaproteobacteria bacterium]|nr:hypothetical protein [Alphaproteobacteria bacterium]